MDRDLPTSDRPSPGILRPKVSAALAGAVDRDTAATLAASLRRRPGHVVVTAPFATTAARLFELAEPQLGATRVVRIPARLLLEGEVARAIVGGTQRGVPPPSAAALASVLDEARRRKAGIAILVDDADAIQLHRLDHVREMIDRTPGMREVVRLVLLGGAPLRRLLDAPEARPFVQSLALNLHVSSPEALTLPRPAGARPGRRRRSRDDAQRLRNEKLLVLAVGAVLVTGVLLFPIEPTVYPPAPGRGGDDGEPPAMVDATPAVPVEPAAPAPAAPVSTETEALASKPDTPAADVSASEAGVARAVASGPAAALPPGLAPAAEATPAAPVADGPSSPAGERAAPAPAERFRPPARPGPAFQLGAFRDRANAVRLAERLVADFGDVYIDQLGTGSASLFRVRVPIPAAVLGESMLAKALAERGYDPLRVE